MGMCWRVGVHKEVPELKPGLVWSQEHRALHYTAPLWLTQSTVHIPSLWAFSVYFYFTEGEQSRQKENALVQKSEAKNHLWSAFQYRVLYSNTEVKIYKIKFIQYIKVLTHQYFCSLLVLQ